MIMAMLTAAANPGAAGESDKQKILAHIDAIFRAYIAGDRKTIEKLHTTDWVGFQGPSGRIERGIGDYMRNADRSLEAFQGTAHELLDVEVQIFGDVALVWYVARYDYRTHSDGTSGSLSLRSVDVYRKKDGEWNQSGSHIAVVPDSGAWGEGSAERGSHHFRVTAPAPQSRVTRSPSDSA